MRADYTEQGFRDLVAAHGDTVDLLREACLWRGFLVGGTAGGAVEPLERAGTPDEERWVRERAAGRGSWIDRARAVYFLRSRHGMTGAYDHFPPGKWLSSSLATFGRCRFGVRVPVFGLDAGIALFVKALPQVGLLTSYSCSGHGGEGPVQLGFHDRHHASWFHYLKDDVGLFGADLRGVGARTRVSAWDGWVVACDEQPDDPYVLWRMLQRAARSLLDPRVNRVAWELKQGPGFPPAPERAREAFATIGLLAG